MKGAGIRRTLAGVACAIVPALSGLVAGQPVVAAEQPATIRLWDYHVHDKKFRKGIFDQFSKDNPDIKVTYTSQVSGTYETALDASFRSGDPPDIFVGTVAATMSKMVEMGWITPLDDIAPSKEALKTWMALFPQDQLPFVEATNMFGGKVYSWPTVGQGAYSLLIWNTKLFREAGLKGPGGGPAVPETWDDMRTFARKITELGQGKVYGIVHGIKSPFNWAYDIHLSIANTTGWTTGGFDFKTGRFDFHHPGFRGAVQVWLDMKKDGSIFPGDLSMDDEQAKFRFTQDLAGMQFGGYWNPGGYLAINDALEFDVVLPPLQKKGERKSYMAVGPLATTSEYVVSSKTKNRDAVWRVIQFMTSAQYQEGWVKAGGGISVFPEYNKEEFFPHFTIAKIAQLGTGSRRVLPLVYFTPLMNDVYSEGQNESGKPDIWEIATGMWIGQLGWEAYDDVERRLNTSFDAAIARAQGKGLAVSLSDFIFPDWDPTKNYSPPKPRK